jgi:hypothetical protein
MTRGAVAGEDTRVRRDIVNPGGRCATAIVTTTARRVAPCKRRIRGGVPGGERRTQRDRDDENRQQDDRITSPHASPSSPQLPFREDGVGLPMTFTRERRLFRQASPLASRVTRRQRVQRPLLLHLEDGVSTMLGSIGTRGSSGSARSRCGLWAVVISSSAMQYPSAVPAPVVGAGTARGMRHGR